MNKKIKRVKRWVREHTIGLIIGVILAVGVIGGYYTWQYFVNQMPQEGELTEAEQQEVKAYQAKKDEEIEFRIGVSEALESGDEAAMQKVEGQIAAEAEAARKVEMYVELSNIYFDQGKVAESLAAAKKAEDASGDKFLVADWLSRVYEYQHDYSKAIYYYDLAGKHAQSPQNSTRLDATYYENQVKRLRTMLDEGIKR